MNNNPFTIQTYFPTGDTRSYRISQVPTRTIQSIYSPREELEKAIKERDELQYNGLYFLLMKKDIYSPMKKLPSISVKVKMLQVG